MGPLIQSTLNEFWHAGLSLCEISAQRALKQEHMVFTVSSLLLLFSWLKLGLWLNVLWSQRSFWVRVPLQSGRSEGRSTVLVKHSFLTAALTSETEGWNRKKNCRNCSGLTGELQGHSIKMLILALSVHALTRLTRPVGPVGWEFSSNKLSHTRAPTHICKNSS